MSSLAATILTIALIVLGTIAMLLLERRKKARWAEASCRHDEGLDHPDFEALEDYFGHPLPAVLKELYADKQLIRRDDILIRVPDPLDGGNECYVAFFEPANLENAGTTDSICKGMFAFASNGAGDLYLIDPREADPEVIYYLHESGERRAMGVTLSQFIRAPRRPVPDE